MNGSGCMHSKLQLLKFPGFLRIVVPSGNLVSYDWGETGTMENACDAQQTRPYHIRMPINPIC